MLHYKDPEVRAHLFEGLFGLEKEGLRVDAQGNMAQSLHPLHSPCIDRDFCENQTEINTRPHASLEGAMEELRLLTDQIHVALAPLKEVLWPFSNPCLLAGEDSIPTAKMKDSYSRIYREYLAQRYGKYKMTFSGIHFNFSFSDSLLNRDFERSDYTDFASYKNHIYLSLAAKCAKYSWVITALTAASPVLDGSFYEKELKNHTCFNGMASLRCSELGYWNFFTPILEYSSLEGYIHSIEEYCHKGFLSEPRELYYPIRLKPPGKNNLENLKHRGVDHIELRMLDLNPLVYEGLHCQDALFCQLLLVWLACQPYEPLDTESQILCTQNFKSAAHYDLETARIVYESSCAKSVKEAALEILDAMEDFYSQVNPEYLECLVYQKNKLLYPRECRYAWKIQHRFQKDYIEQGLALGRQYQKQALERQKPGENQSENHYGVL